MAHRIALAAHCQTGGITAALRAMLPDDRSVEESADAATIARRPARQVGPTAVPIAIPAD